MAKVKSSITAAREKIIYQTHLHWILFLESAGILTLGTLVWMLGHRYAPQYQIYFSYLSLPFFVYGGFKLLLEWIQHTSSDFVITSNRIVIKVGVLKRSSLSMPLNKIESIEVDQTITGQLFGYGSIHITGTGTATSKFDFINNPSQFRQKIQQASHGGADEDTHVTEKPKAQTGTSYRRKLRRR
jgi:uncharacterized membrane protein YdbT with pleckstrin-like domain